MILPDDGNGCCLILQGHQFMALSPDPYPWNLYQFFDAFISNLKSMGYSDEEVDLLFRLRSKGELDAFVTHSNACAFSDSCGGMHEA